MNKKTSGLRALLCCAAALGALSACGGGSGDAAGGPAPVSGPPPTLYGTVAVGAPIVGGTVNVKCASGSASATTDGAGNFSLRMMPTGYPCLLQVSGGTVRGAASDYTMVSAALGDGMANITPLSHLLLAELFGKDPVQVYGSFDTADTTKLTVANMSLALGRLGAEMTRLAVVLPVGLDPMKTGFVADPSNVVDRTLEVVMRHLGYAAKSLPQATQEVATATLDIRDNVKAQCVPGVITGYSNPAVSDAMIQVPPADGGGGGDGGDGGGSGGDGAGAGGSLGQFRNTLVIVEREDGQEIGRAVTDNDRGMVTIVPCQYNGPARIRFVGTQTNAEYFDEALNTYVSFFNQELCAVVPAITQNIGVTPLTNAACGVLESVASSAAATAATTERVIAQALAEPPAKAAKGPAPGVTPSFPKWANADAINKANQTVLSAMREHYPSIFDLTDITRLPVLLNERNFNLAGTLPANQHGIYAANIAGLVKSASRFSRSPAPALELAKQLRADFSDGKLDQQAGGKPIAANPAYAVETLWNLNTVRTGIFTDRLGDPTLRARVVRIKRASRSEVAANALEGETLYSNGRILSTVRDPLNAAAYISFEAAPPTPDVRFVEVETSPQFSAAIAESGEVYVRIDKTDKTWSGPLPGFGNAANPATALNAAGDCLFARLSDGTLRRTEVTSTGQPCVAVAAFPKDVTSIYSGRIANYVIDANRGVLAWGQVARDLGIGNDGFAAVTVPTPVVDLKNVQMIYPWSVDSSAGGFGQTAYALTNDGKLYGWGAPNLALQPNGDFSERSRLLRPTLIANLPPVCWVSGSYAVGCDGTLYWWGFNVPVTKTAVVTNVWRVIAPTTNQGQQNTIAITKDGRTFQLRRVVGPNGGPPTLEAIELKE